MPRTASNVDLPWLPVLDRGAGNLARQLSQVFRDAIQRGDLRVGEAVPSTRLLAAVLQTARGTVVEAYAQLIAEGFLESKSGAGTRVAIAFTDIQPAQVRDRNASEQQRVDLPRAVLPPHAARFARITAEFRALPAVPFAGIHTIRIGHARRRLAAAW